jgi:glycosidase
MKKLFAILIALLFVCIYSAGDVEEQGCPEGKVEVIFRYVPFEGEKVDSVSLRGSFNNWEEWPMERLENGAWEIRVCLEPGEHRYKYFINGEWPKDMEKGHKGKPIDLEAQGYVDDGFGGQNALRIIEPKTFYFAHEPNDPAYLCISNEKLVLRVKTPPGKVSSVNLIFGDGEKIPMEKQLWWDYGEMWRVSLPFLNSLKYRFEANTFEEEKIFLPKSGHFFFDENYSFQEVSWVNDGVIYQIFPERFYNGNLSNDAFALGTDEYNYNPAAEEPILSNWSDPIAPQHCCHQYFGGDIEGIIDKIEYLDSLGVNLIYLNPIFDSGSVHGYDTHDYLHISPKFGTKEVLNQFLTKAHVHGIKVIFDFVPNHTGLGFWAFQDVVKKGPESEYWDWYFIKEYPFKPGNSSAYECWWNVGSLPKLNTTNPQVKDYLFDVVDYWLDFGFDGLRIDVPNEVIDAHGFFAEIREIVKEEHPNAYIVGEIWSLDNSWLKGDEFDSLMNYALGRNILLPYANGAIDGEIAFSKLAKYFAAYGENVVNMGFNIVSSHDTGRILTDLGGGNFNETIPKSISILRLKLLSTLLYSMPGAPVIFQGDERGILGEKEFHDSHRYPIQWDYVKEELLLHYKKLSRIKNTRPELKEGAIALYESNGNALSFFKGEEKGILVVANNGLTTTSFKLPPGGWKVIGSNEIFEGTLKIPPIRAAVLKQV